MRRETEASKGFSHVLDTLVDVITELKKEDTRAVGIGAPGLITHPEGTILTLPNIPGGEGVPIQQTLFERTGLPCLADNDANCFTLAGRYLDFVQSESGANYGYTGPGRGTTATRSFNW